MFHGWSGWNSCGYTCAKCKVQLTVVLYWLYLLSKNCLLFTRTFLFVPPVFIRPPLQGQVLRNEEGLFPPFGSLFLTQVSSKLGWAYLRERISKLIHVAKLRHCALIQVPRRLLTFLTCGDQTTDGDCLTCTSVDSAAKKLCGIKYFYRKVAHCKASSPVCLSERSQQGLFANSHKDVHLSKN